MVEAGLSDDEARARFYPVGLDGLMVEGDTGIEPGQLSWVRKRSEVADWTLSYPGHISLLDVMKNVRPAVLIGTSGAAGAFTEEAVRAMAAGIERPAIFPLSNPTSHSEAVPDDLMKWTGGRAVIGTGSPFPNVDQTNNSYIFPGVALGIVASSARRVTDGMFMAGARALADLSPSRFDRKARLLPPVTELRSVSLAVAAAVARKAFADGVADPIPQTNLSVRIAAEVWKPEYLPYLRRG